MIHDSSARLGAADSNALTRASPSRTLVDVESKRRLAGMLANNLVGSSFLVCNDCSSISYSRWRGLCGLGTNRLALLAG